MERWAQVDGLRVRYLQCGSGPPLLLLHGLLGYSFCWRHNLEALSRHFTVYAVDLPGTGYSERQDNMDCSLRGIATRMIHFLDFLGIDSCHLLGNSLGGAVAVMMAALWAESGRQRARSLTLVAPVNPWSLQGKERALFLSRPLMSVFVRMIGPWFSRLQAYWLKRMYGDPSSLTPQTLNDYVAPLRQRGTLGYALQVARCWDRTLEDVRTALPLVAHLPALLIWGDKDAAVYPASAEPMRKAFHNARLVMLPGVGHLPQEEASDEFNRQVIAFLTMEAAKPAPSEASMHG